MSDVKNDYDYETAIASKVTADVVRDLGGMATASVCEEVGFAIVTAIQ